MYDANNFNVHGASFRMQLPLFSPSYFPALFFARWPYYVYIYTSVSIRPGDASVAPFRARLDAEILRYYSAIWWCTGHPRDGLSGIITHELMKLRAVLAAFENPILYFLAHHYLTLHADSNDQIVDRIDIKRWRMLLLFEILNSIGNKVHSLSLFSAQSSVSLFFIKDYMRFLQYLSINLLL